MITICNDLRSQLPLNIINHNAFSLFTPYFLHLVALHKVLRCLFLTLTYSWPASTAEPGISNLVCFSKEIISRNLTNYYNLHVCLSIRLWVGAYHPAQMRGFFKSWTCETLGRMG